MSDQKVVNMPPIRVNANIAMAKKREIETLKEDQKMRLKSVDVRKFIKTKSSPKDRPSRVFETTDSHYRYNKNHSFVKQAITSLQLNEQEEKPLLPVNLLHNTPMMI